MTSLEREARVVTSKIAPKPRAIRGPDRVARPDAPIRAETVRA